MRVPYPRPATLSDPYMDWMESGAEIQRVVATDPASLTRDDYWMIFYQNLPAANYQEGCFYVPFFLAFYRRAPDFTAPGFDGFFWFIDHFRDDFVRDNLLSPILDEIWDIFLTLTATFSVHRLTDAELEEHGISPSYREMAPRSRVVHEMLDAFTSWPVYDPLLERLRTHFAPVQTPAHSFWFCECAFHTRTWLWVDSEPAERRQALFDYFHRFEHFSPHYRNSFLNMKGNLTEGFFQYNVRMSPTG
jgi:hypothetical protein